MLLETQRLRLRPLKSADLEHLVALAGDPQVMAFITGVGETREVVEREGLPELLRRRAWVLCDQASNAFVGWASLRMEGDGAELGYRLLRSAWGQGYAAEAARALVDLAWVSPASGARPWR